MDLRAAAVGIGIGAIVAATGCGGAATRTGEAARAERERLQSHVGVLASDALEGRMTGTAGYAAAADYVAGQFRAIGLEPAGTDGYFQAVPYAVANIDATRSHAWLHRGGRRRELAWKADWIAGVDVLRERVKVKAAMVFVGYGVDAPELNYDDYAGLDVRGKIVVTMLGAPKSFPVNPRAHYTAPPVKEAMAAAHGAVGIVVLRDAHFAQAAPWAAVANNAGRVPSMKWVAADGAAADYFATLRGNIVLSEAAAAELFKGAPKSHAEVMAADAAGEALPRFALAGELEIDRRGALSRLSSPNVAGVLRGADPRLAAETLVFTAHLDHLGVGAPVDGDAIYNGMYDDAMGVAVMLEVARALASRPQRPRRSVLFLATGGEERGLLGSDYFAHYPTVPISQLVAAINFDNPVFLFPLADVVAFGSEHSTLGAAAEAAARAEGVKLTPDPLPDEVRFIRSDQYSFVRQGVPALFLTPGTASGDPAVDGTARVMEFRRAHYHKPSDDLSRPVDWNAAATFTRLSARVGAEVADAEEPPRWQPGNFFGERFGRPRATAR